MNKCIIASHIVLSIAPSIIASKRNILMEIMTSSKYPITVRVVFYKRSHDCFSVTITDHDMISNEVLAELLEIIAMNQDEFEDSFEELKCKYS